jgi:hypothetical protein
VRWSGEQVGVSSEGVRRKRAGAIELPGPGPRRVLTDNAMDTTWVQLLLKSPRSRERHHDGVAKTPTASDRKPLTARLLRLKGAHITLVQHLVGHETVREVKWREDSTVFQV